MGQGGSVIGEGFDIKENGTRQMPGAVFGV